MAIVFLDTGIIGLVTSPRKQGQAYACEQWLFGLLARGVNIVSSEICDYEVRRNLILEANLSSKVNSLNNLDELDRLITFLPVTTAAFRTAAQLWAEARLNGIPTADNLTLDADVIICAQWRLISAEYPGQLCIIATTNVKHISRFAIADEWQNIVM
jgi:predicted nucleic acid-binding protein